ncbi:hypothetical protein I6N95_04295 [Vagococcus sp. BWB3-3]|uniref:Uncharacterized protein n=1 Tax=Vagococcus allomyrinae TaxID=2794353 RepID=A0A940SVD6_9ENTE|nr:hypothetical protein [Vagococcus allomyrinae]MBP1040228.1 hypothetical protein [Vagococcus allomyrinae]
MANKRVSVQEMGIPFAKVSHQRYAALEKDNQQLQHELRVTRQISQQFSQVIQQLAKLELTEKSPPFEQLIQQGLLLGEGLVSGDSIDAQIGRYLLAAKQEAQRIVRQALEMSELIAQPGMPTKEHAGKAIHLANKGQTHKSALASTSYRARLSRVKSTSQTQCRKLMTVVDDKAARLIDQQK